MPSRGRGGEAERQKERLATWRGLSKNVPFMRALREGATLYEPAIARACEAFGLTVGNPRDRELLLAILADVLFRPRVSGALSASLFRKRGRPKEWSEDKQTRLERAIVKVCAPEELANGGPSVRMIAKRLRQSQFAQELQLPSQEALENLIAKLLRPSQ